MMQRIALAILASTVALGGEVCYRDHYSVAHEGHGIDTCPRGYEKSGLLCYKKCADGYYGVGPVCWSYCPAGWRDDGALCNNRGGWTIVSKNKGAGCPWYDVCGLWNDCTECPAGTSNHGCTCHKTMEVRAKKSYGRGWGKPLQCADDEIQQGLFCYPKCRTRGSTRYNNVGHVCWEECRGDNPFEYGAACCADGAACAKWTAEMSATGVAAIAGAVATVATGGAAAAVIAGLVGAGGTAVAAQLAKPYCDSPDMMLYSTGKCQGNPVKTMSNQTAAQCMNACMAYGSCEYATYQPDTDACYMYTVCNIDEASIKLKKYETFEHDTKGSTSRRLMQAQDQ